MAAESPGDVVRAILQNWFDADEFDRLTTEDVTTLVVADPEHVPWAGTVRDKSHELQVRRMTPPGISMSVTEDPVVEGNRVAALSVARRPATGLQLGFHGVFEVRGGRVASIRMYYDTAHRLAQSSFAPPKD